METRFKRKSQILDIGITAVSAVLSVGKMLICLALSVLLLLMFTCFYARNTQ